MATYLLWLYSIHSAISTPTHSHYTAEFITSVVFSKNSNMGMRRAKECWKEF